MKEETISELNTETKTLSKWHIFLLWVAFNIIGPFVVAAIISQKSKKEEYDSKKYRKVIKKGFFWDSIEYHEREIIIETPQTPKN